MANEYDAHLGERPGTPYGIDPDDITTGKRLNLNACQYWVKGMPGFCKYWDKETESCIFYEEVIDPSGENRRIYPSEWNSGKCDFLGRRATCDKYDNEGEENLEQYMCIAPSCFRSGLYEVSDVGVGVPVSKESVTGYNEVNGTGQCDERGTGKGAPGAGVAVDEYLKLPVICRYYKPWHMGFGAVTPKTTDITKITIDEDGVLHDEREELEARLPLSFSVYNIRAKTQKCAHWNKDFGSDFIIFNDDFTIIIEDEEEGDPFDVDGKIEFCTCTDARAFPYCTRNEDPFVTLSGVQMILENVWSNAGGIICNGARPECPCYTGKWIYCLDEKLEAGDKVSAQQIMELRFWMNDWSSQEEYDNTFKMPPNRTDPSTSDIYTYHEWKRIGEDVEDHILKGKKVHMCVPTYDYEFSDDLLQVSELIFKQDKGTAVKDLQVSFPSLVREIDVWYSKPLNIIYPYSNRDPFSADLNPICSDDKDKTPCIKRNYSMDGNDVMVYGFTVKEKNVYAFNLEHVTDFVDLRMIRSYDNDFQIDRSDKEEFYEYMVSLIDSLDRECLLYESQADVDGMFYVGPVSLTYQKLNTIVICVDFGDGTWGFRKRAVWSQWHGGILKQCDVGGTTAEANTFAFSHEYGDSQYVTTEKQYGFGPSAIANGMAIALEGRSTYDASTTLQSILPVYSNLVKSLMSGDYFSYSYCIKTTTQEGVETTRWRNASNAGHVWVDIDDNSLNYVFGNNVTSAKMVIENDVGEETTIVELERVHPNSSTTERIDMPPNAFLLKPKDSSYKKNFFKSDSWILKITYWYRTISTDTSIGENEEMYWPSSCRFQSSPYQISYEAGDSNITPFSVTDIVLGTNSVMGLFADEDGRIISAFATKMCVNIVEVLCRDVEIKYQWKCYADQYKLMPDTGWPTELGAPESMGVVEHNSLPPCGDHEQSWFSGAGPIWYPYTSCEVINFYDVWTGATFCTMPHEGVPRLDYRMCGPEVYRAYAGDNPSTGQTCANDYIYYYSQGGEVLFTGWVKRKKQVNALWYQAMEWSLPKFGNVSREYVERYMSMDSISYLSLRTGSPAISHAWMPAVIDHTNFYLSFNSFDQTSYNDIFSHVNQLNFMICRDVSEEIKEDRKSFEDIFSVRQMIFASYPDPMIDDGSAYNKVNFYYFNDEKYMYAWQEKWKDIERTVDDSDRLDFVGTLDKPNYVYDLYKGEHRFISEEGTYTLYYKAPDIDKENGAIITFPSLQLGAGPERWFGILYTGGSESDEVTWADENFGAVDGSGGDEDGNVYQKTYDREQWMHSDYTLFDFDFAQTYDEAKAKEREVTISYDYVNEELIKKVYNTGIEVSIPRSRLKYLPYEETELQTEFEFDPQQGVHADTIFFGGEYNWYCDVLTDIVATLEIDSNEYISKVEIKGYKGIIAINDGVEGRDIELIVPGIDVFSSVDDNINNYENIYDGGYPVTLTVQEREDKIYEEFTSEIEFDINPTKMIRETTKLLKINFRCYAGFGISLSSIKINIANYIDASEVIKIWERKYYVSEGTAGTFNPNGPQRPLMFDWNFDNSGVYFLASGAHTGKVASTDKMRNAHADIEWFEDEDIPVTTAGQLQGKEQTEQKNTYESAYAQEGVLGDERTYAGVCPIRVKEFFDEVGVSFPFTRYGATIRSEKVPWSKHYLVGGYTSYNLWQPGGHYFRWKETTEQKYCWWPISPLYDIYSVKFVHAHPPGGSWTEEPTNPYVSLYYLRKAYYVGKGIHNHSINRSRRALGDGADMHNVGGLIQ